MLVLKSNNTIQLWNSPSPNFFIFKMIFKLFTCVCVCMCVCVCVLSCFSSVWLCDCMDCSPPGSSVHGILQARILEWFAMPSSSRSSWPGDQTLIFLLLHWQVGSLPLVPLGSHHTPKSALAKCNLRIKCCAFIYQTEIVVGVSLLYHRGVTET